MAAAGPPAAGETQGRVLLQRAVGAIEEGRWDDLARLLQQNAPALQAARLRLERHALERHAARRCPAAAAAPAKLAAAAAEPPTVPAARTQARAAGQWAPACAPRGDVAPWARRTDAGGGFTAAALQWADRAPWRALLTAQVLVAASYAPALLYSGFKMDDAVAIEKNQNVVGEASLAEFLRRDFWGLPMHGAGWTNKSFRPFTTLTYRWNFLLHGLDSCGFHATNVLLHCVTSIFLGRAAMSLGFSGGWAAAAALFFGVHPVHTENVLYLVGRADVLAALFGLQALIVYATAYCPALPLAAAPDAGRPHWGGPASSLIWLAPAALLVIASGLCKETGFMLFALFLLMELLDLPCLRGGPALRDALAAAPGAGARARLWRRVRLRVGLLVAATFVVFVARYRHTGGTKLNMSPQDNPISFEADRFVRVLSYAFLHGVYARLLCWPQFLCYDYSMDAIPLVRTAVDCRLLLPLAAYVGFAASAASGLRAPARYRRAFLLSLALLVVPFLPASNILFPVGTVIGERLLYIPSAGFCLAFLAGLHRLLAQGALAGLDAGSPPHGRVVAADPRRRLARGGPASMRQRPAPAATNGVGPRELAPPAAAFEGGRLPLRRHARLVSALTITAVVVLAVRTWFRVRVWETSETLYINDGFIQPTSSKVQFNLGITHMQRQEWDAAVDALVRCAWADPLSSLPFYRIGQIEIMRGRFESAEYWLSAALDKFGASLMVRDEEVFHDLAVAMFQNGRQEAAEMRLRVALQLNPDFAKGWNNFACCVAARDLHDATRASRKAVSLAPDNPQYWANLALLSQHAGDVATASASWRQALELWPQMPEPRDCTWEFAPA